MDSDEQAPVSWATVAGYTMLGVVLFGWFLHGVFIERQGLVDSMGESLGSAVTALLIVSVVASFRAPGRRSVPPARTPQDGAGPPVPPVASAPPKKRASRHRRALTREGPPR
ncbi:MULTISPECIES: hypothetical protein [Catenuloplanes]|uniref:Uncharacterized protein n=1 Tax=Catenuloplanes niger TaxID=587534 RepID=A0AAE3ZNA3_9ACTN|nr:hypothetical protein [Catenuloplanes niger]MDR7323073.1 hypothetical protein [Catenuloplanes niger]